MKTIVKVVKRHPWENDVDVFGICADIDACITKPGSQIFTCELIAKSLTKEMPILLAIEQGYTTYLTDLQIDGIKDGRFHLYASIAKDKYHYRPFDSFRYINPCFLEYDENANKLTFHVAKYKLKDGFVIEDLQREAENAFKAGLSYSNKYAFERID